MHQPYALLLLPLIFALLYFVVLLADKIVQSGREFWKRHICKYYYGPEECFTCNKPDSECGTCPVLIKSAMMRKEN